MDEVISVLFLSKFCIAFRADEFVLITIDIFWSRFRKKVIKSYYECIGAKFVPCSILSFKNKDTLCF